MRENEAQTRIEIRVRDRVGVVSEITGAIASLGLPIRQHQARVVRERSGQEASVFRADLAADEAGIRDLRRRITRIKGFLDIQELGRYG